MLKRTPSLTEQAKAHIKQRIVNDEFDEGRIPSETTLADEMGVSRTTVRDALSRLELEGAVYRKQGAGTFVNEPGLRIQTRLEEVWAYESMLKAHGYTPSTHILDIASCTTDAHIVSALNLDEGDTTMVVKKLFLADDEPVIYVENYIPQKLVVGDYTANDFHQPIYQSLSDLTEEHLTYYISDIIPLVASANLLKILNLSPNTALISFDEVGYNQENRPILYSRSYFKDDLLRLRLLRRKTL